MIRKSIKFNLHNWVILFWTITFLQLRPSIIGQKYNVFAFFLFTISNVVYWIYKKRISLKTDKILAKESLLFVFFYSYLLINGLILSDSTNAVINSVLFSILTIPFFLIIIGDENSKLGFLKSFINIHFVLSISSIITFIIYLIGNFSYDKLPWVIQIEFMKDMYKSGHFILFPFTIIWSSGFFLDIPFPRFVVFYKEPGIAQMFLATSFFLTYRIKINRAKIKRMLILFGLLLTFSTTAFISLAAGYLAMSGSFF